MKISAYAIGQIQEAIVRIYLINDAIVLIVDTRLRLPTEILL